MKKSLLIMMVSFPWCTVLHPMERPYDHPSLDTQLLHETVSKRYTYTTINEKLLQAIHMGNLSIVRKLCTHVACDPSYNYSAEYFTIDSLHDLAQQRCSLYYPFALPIYTTTIFHHATALGNKEIIEKLLQTNKVSINRQDSRGQTPLLLAPNAIVADLLLENGANPNIPDHEGNTPLSYAAIGIEDPALTMLLLTNGANRKALIPKKTQTIEERVEAIDNPSIACIFNPYAPLRTQEKRAVARKLFE